MCIRDSFFKPLLEQLEAAFGQESLYKKGVNSMIGCWFINENYRYHVETSNDDRRLVRFDGNQYVKDAGHGYVDHIERIELLSLSNMSAILRQVLDWELVMLSQAIHWLNLGPERAIKQARVDSLTIQGSQKLFKKVRAMGELRHKDLRWDTPFSKYKWWPSESGL